MRYLGIGIQKVEEELHTLIPSIALSRMDSDTTRRKHSHYNIIKGMETGKLDLLLGTQMVAKGHDLPDVTVSAVMLSDIALNLPDFRSAERAFQLFAQLAGRAGRGDHPGRVYIQTYSPGHYVFDYVKRNDYKGFYKKEISQREELSYPPFGRMVRIVLQFRTREQANDICASIATKIRQRSCRGITLLGPSPAPIERVKNHWRWHIIIKGKKAKSIRNEAFNVMKMFQKLKQVKMYVDVDPVNLL